MKTSNILKTAVIVFSFFLSTEAFVAQHPSPSKESPREVVFTERNLGGPRLGLTYRVGPLTEKEETKAGRLISQFGWHFEYLVIPKGGGPSFAIQFIPMIGGVEYGYFIPSTTLAFGIRLPGGIEFGLGPNLLLLPDEIGTALVVAVGKSIDYGGVSIPIDIAWTTNPSYNRVSLIVGYSIP